MARYYWVLGTLVPFLTLFGCTPNPDQTDDAVDTTDGNDTTPTDDGEDPDTTDPPDPRDAFLRVDSLFTEDPSTTPELFDWAPRSEPCIVTVWNEDAPNEQPATGPTGTDIKVWSGVTLRIELGYQEERSPVVVFADDADQSLIPDGTLPVHPLPDGGQAVAMPIRVDPLASGEHAEREAQLSRFVTGDWTCAGPSRAGYATRATTLRVSFDSISAAFGDGYAIPTFGDELRGYDEYGMYEYQGGFFDNGTRVWFTGGVTNDCWAANRPGGDPNSPTWLQ